MYSVKKEEAPFKETSFLSYLHACIIIVTYPVDQVLFIFYYCYHKLWWKGWKSETKLPRWKKLYIYINHCRCLHAAVSVYQVPLVHCSQLSLWYKKLKLSKNTPWDRYWFQFFQQGVGKFIFPSKFKWGSFFCDSRSKIDISETSLKLFLKRVYTSGNIFLLLATAQQTLLILCSVGVSVVLRLHSDAI